MDDETASPRPEPDEILELLRGVIDPELGSDIVDLGMAKGVSVGDDGLVTVTVALTTAGCPLRGQIQKDVKARIRSLPGVEDVKIDWSELDQDERSAAMAKARWNVSREDQENEIPPDTKVVTVSSGKGGVGKSSVTANLAAAVASQGYTVGVMDADIWGFSIPHARRRGPARRRRTRREEDRSHEKSVGAGTLKIVSMGFLVDDEESALMWRGLMLNRAVQHFLEDVKWGEMDYLLIDMPPGTGDVQMGLARMLPRAEMIVVTTPSVGAQKVAIRAVNMARKSYIRVVGVVENMSEFTCEHGARYELFGRGGGGTLARDAGVPLLGQIPIEPSVAHGADTGTPVALGEGNAAEAFQSLATTIVEEAVPPVAMAGCSARMLDAAVAALDDE
ncbi:MAG: Mrp/NBP35 family ATP-binding protein [Acidimicrobiia bacterium]|nr:Mrp/NBP35 family ATP-binding protein [Acidimicrobiia bacterium]